MPCPLGGAGSVPQEVSRSQYHDKMPLCPQAFSSSPAETLIHMCSQFLKSFSFKAGKKIFTQAHSHLNPSRFLLELYGQPLVTWDPGFFICIRQKERYHVSEFCYEDWLHNLQGPLVQTLLSISRWFQHCSHTHDVGPGSLG